MLFYWVEIISTFRVCLCCCLFLKGDFFIYTCYSVACLFGSHPGTVSRKIFNTREAVDSIPYDHDENKYQRRGAIDWFTRWFWWATHTDLLLAGNLIEPSVKRRFWRHTCWSGKLTACENDFFHMTWFDHQKRFSWVWDPNVFLLNALMNSCILALPYSAVPQFTQFHYVLTNPTQDYSPLRSNLLYLPYSTYCTLPYSTFPNFLILSFPTPPLTFPCPSLPSPVVVSFLWSTL